MSRRKQYTKQQKRELIDEFEKVDKADLTLQKRRVSIIIHFQDGAQSF